MRFIGQTLRNMNRLSLEKSPYLLQHKSNPINWYPWGKEAFEKAKQENLPIFLSVGYSTCHWCHVMEKESFENPDTAKILNDNFVSIKVDREERPDVDKLYMAFVVAVSGHGGWPMSVFLTPDLAPITGGTYFPPDDSRGMMGFPTILKMISGEWQKDHENLKKQGSIVLGLLKTEPTKAGDVKDSDEVFEALYSHKNATFDARLGGFGKAPKFPKASDLDFLIAYAAANNNPPTAKCTDTIKMLAATLDAMSHGGIHDHIAGGFHRYSVDAEWHVPHFEKMLYDQAQLLATYADFYRLQRGEECRLVIEDIYGYLMGELRHPEGAFYSAQDADSLPSREAKKKVEGAFAVWEKEEIRALLKEDSVFDIFCEYFDVEDGGNVASDPHGEFRNKNVLRRLLTDQECATNFNLEVAKLLEIIGDAKRTLLTARRQRPAPHLDSKMVCAWQGLAISGLVKAYQALGDAKYLEAAENCRGFVEKYLQNVESGELRRSVYLAEDGKSIEFGTDTLAFSDDYAFLIQGLLDLYTVTGNDKVLKNAHRLQNIMDEKFWNGSGYYVSEENQESGIGVRMVEDQDGAEPCATSIATNNLLRFYDILEVEKYRDNANLCLRGAAERLNKIPIALPKLAVAHRRWQNGSTTFVLVGKPDSELLETTKKLLNERLISDSSVVHVQEEDTLSSSGPSHSAMLSGPQPAVYICSGFVCGRPLRTVAEVLAKFEKDF